MPASPTQSKPEASLGFPPARRGCWRRKPPGCLFRALQRKRGAHAPEEWPRSGQGRRLILPSVCSGTTSAHRGILSRIENHGCTPVTTTREIGAQRLAGACLLAARTGGWVSIGLLGAWFWPHSKKQYEHGRQLAHRLVASRLMLDRKTGGLQHLYALADAGRQLVYDTSPEWNGRWIADGTRWGRFELDGWHPPARWVHDNRACRFLAYWRSQGEGRHVYFEHEVRVHEKGASLDMAKIPDGLAVEGNRGYWVEVENSRKTGGERWHLIDHMILNAQGSTPPVRVRWHDPVRIAPVSILVVPPAYRLAAFERQAVRRLRAVGAASFRCQVAIDCGDHFDIGGATTISTTPDLSSLADDEVIELDDGVEVADDGVEAVTGSAPTPDDEAPITFHDIYAGNEEVTVTAAEWRAEVAKLSPAWRAQIVHSLSSGLFDRRTAIETWRRWKYGAEMEAELKALPQELATQYRQWKYTSQEWNLDEMRRQHAAWTRRKAQEAIAAKARVKAEADARAAQESKDARFGGLGRWLP